MAMNRKVLEFRDFSVSHKSIVPFSLLSFLLQLQAKMVDPKTDKLVRRTTMVATAVASYFLLTADYGTEPSALDPIKNAILSAERSMKDFIFGSKDSVQKNEAEKVPNVTEKH
ncbi:unnamed protein product [Cuscuta epithymum]|uniref:Uncharacterized protein n=1 Tax=Cuscuta epithymum TaxID=186058 RepID=A0AAV0CYZ9_9ASTE|nr:unnamed protein product [Cuscuta epithymum]